MKLTAHLHPVTRLRMREAALQFACMQSRFGGQLGIERTFLGRLSFGSGYGWLVSHADGFEDQAHVSN
jgi:hypothetical protein